jgi:hypothetical protein
VDVLIVLMWTCHGSCVVKPRAPRARATRHAHRTVYIYWPPEEGTSDERAKKDPVLLSTARPTSLASEPNHSGGVAGCTHEKGVHIRAGKKPLESEEKKKKERFIYKYWGACFLGEIVYLSQSQLTFLRSSTGVGGLTMVLQVL